MKFLKLESESLANVKKKLVFFDKLKNIKFKKPSFNFKSDKEIKTSPKNIKWSRDLNLQIFLNQN